MRNVVSSRLACSEDKDAEDIFHSNIWPEIVDIYSRSSVAMYPMGVGSDGYTLNKSSPSGMRSTGGSDGNSTKLSARQLPLLGFCLIDDLLSKGSRLDMTTRPSGKVVVTEREILGSREEHTRSLAEAH